MSTNYTREIQLQNGRDLLGQANSLLELLTSTVETAITNGINTINGIVDQLQDIVTRIIEIVGNLLKNLITPLVNSIEKIIKKLLLAGMDTTSCLGDQLKELIDLPEQTVKELTACTDAILSSVRKLAKEAIATIQGLLSVVTGLTDDLTKCVGLNILSCLTNVVTSIRKQLVAIPLEIETTVQNFISSISNLVCKLYKCFNAVEAAIQNAISVVIEILKCFGKLLGFDITKSVNFMIEKLLG